MNDLENLGPTIQRLRRAAGYTLNAFAEQSGVAKSLLSRIENNESNPTLHTLQRISTALNKSLDELLRELEDRPAFLAHLHPPDLPVLTSEDGLCELRITGAIDTVEWLQSYELTARPGGVLRSSPHPHGTIESLFVRSGAARVKVGDQERELSASELLRYRGDLPHAIYALGDEVLTATMTVCCR
jgi:transcriptional regulator with XRE-family HTH domain